MYAFIGAFFLASQALLASDQQDAASFPAWVVSALGVDPSFSPVVASLLTLLLTAIIGFGFRRGLGVSSDFAPPSKVSLRFFVESVLDFLINLSKQQFGKHFRSYLPFISGLFVFILISNLSGLVPGFPPSTESFNSNLAMGLIVFFFYNYSGFREHGLGYGKQFMGPFLILAPLFASLELISHMARPLSLAFRLTANIFGDHLLLSVFSSIVPILISSVLLFFGLLVACIQSFVFTMLTSIYINMAISHDH
jgi:F-type H+-transporting ATPase subunit a